MSIINLTLARKYIKEKQFLIKDLPQNKRNFNYNPKKEPWGVN